MEFRQIGLHGWCFALLEEDRLLGRCSALHAWNGSDEEDPLAHYLQNIVLCPFQLQHFTHPAFSFKSNANQCNVNQIAKAPPMIKEGVPWLVQNCQSRTKTNRGWNFLPCLSPQIFKLSREACSASKDTPVPGCFFSAWLFREPQIRELSLSAALPPPLASLASPGWICDRREEMELKTPRSEAESTQQQERVGIGEGLASLRPRLDCLEC